MANSRTPLFLVSIVIIVVVIIAALFAFNLIGSHFSSPSPSPSATPSSTPSLAPTPTATAALNVTTVILKDNFYTPANLTITQGTTVEWINNGTDIHTTTSYDNVWSSGILQPGQTYSYTFTQSGTFNYFCGVHPTIMFGQIIVIPKT